MAGSAMWSSPKKSASRRPERQVLLTAGYTLALVATLVLLAKSNLINTAALRVWLQSQPGSAAPCDRSTARAGRLAAGSCLPAGAAGGPRQQGRPPVEAHVDALDGAPAAEGRVGDVDGSRSGAEDAALMQEADDEGARVAAELAAGEEEEEAEEERWAREEQQAAAQEAAAQEAAREADEERAAEAELGAAECEDIECLAAAAQQERHPGQFLFPHFFIVGWQKCATTSLFYHLAKHPAVLRAHDKEPEFFSYDCDYDPEECPRKATRNYIQETLLLDEAVEADLRVAAVEASTHYGRNGHVLARRLRAALPWLKVVVSLREPISRAISMLAHNLDKHETGCLTKQDVYGCLSHDLGRENYSLPLQGWLEAFPRQQVYLIQYENITSGATMPGVLRDLKSFLGIHPELPDSDLGMRNTREYHLRQKGSLDKGQEADGWPMKMWQYEALVAQVRPDAQRVAELAGEYGLADPKQWMHAWEEEWRLTLEECDDSGDCIVFPN